MKVLMKCGHSANATNSEGKPVCAICAGITPNAEIISDEVVDLTGRRAKCTYFGRTFKHKGRTVTCHGQADSRIDLAFFEHKPKQECDEFYCGCWGWD